MGKIVGCSPVSEANLLRQRLHILWLQVFSRTLGGIMAFKSILECLNFISAHEFVGLCRPSLLAAILVHQCLDPLLSLFLSLAQQVDTNRFGVPLLLFRRLSNALLLLVDAVDNFCVVVGDIENL